MAFTPSNWSRQSVALNTGEVTVNGSAVGGPAMFSYFSATDAIATIAAANYFSSRVFDLSLNDLIYIVGTDGVGMYVVSAIDRTVNPGTISLTAASLTGAVNTANIVNGAVTADKLASDAVTTAKILNANVTTAKLADNAVTSAKTAINLIQYAQVAVSAAEWNGMYAAPKQLVAAAGANTQIVLHSAKIFLDYGTTQFANGGAVHIQYDSTANGAGTKASDTIAAAGFNSATADSTAQLSGTQAVAAASTTVNKGLYLSNATAAFDTGDSTFKVDVWYSVSSYA